MRLLTVLGSLVVASLSLLDISSPVHAADAARSDQDCAQLLERWASDPKAVPKRVIDTCKEQLASSAPAAAPPVPPATRASAESLEPCSGPDAADSVLCWGPWANLAPAAAAPLVTLNVPDASIECDLLADQCVPALEPLLPVDGCTPGTPCGFATIVSGFTSTGDAENTEFGSFRLAADGTDFSVVPKTGDLSGGDIDSLTMTTIFTDRPDGYRNLRSRGDEGDLLSRLIARVEQDDDDEILLAADIWTHGAVGSGQSGYFAWGNALSQAGLDALNAGNVTASYSGAMSVDNATLGAITVNFGGDPNWTGTWTNPDYSFGAGGTLSGVNLVSEPGQFTSNVTGTDSFVQGALVGEPGGAHGIAHIIDVTLEGQGRIKDVGLLRDLAAEPTVGP